MNVADTISHWSAERADAIAVIDLDPSEAAQK